MIHIEKSAWDFMILHAEAKFANAWSRLVTRDPRATVDLRSTPDTEPRPEGAD